MGSGQSARKLTITNDEELGVIHISNGVAQRLAQGVASQKTKGVADGNAAVGGQWETSSVQQQASPVPQLQSATPTYSTPIHTQPEYTISALKMQQQKEEELGNQNLYWQKRMENLKNSHARVDRILEEEYKRAVDQVASVQGEIDCFRVFSIFLMVAKTGMLKAK